MLILDKQKYIEILKSQGLSAALTALHRDQNLAEYEAFEGQSGYKTENFNRMSDYHTFSRELWDIANGVTLTKV